MSMMEVTEKMKDAEVLDIYLANQEAILGINYGNLECGD